ncbi:MAG: DNA topoisomerase (ATP-hydrolyzing) subunit A [Simkaniaceae bacterium]|nr:DNA topoisomerase (ATP-hydrolyzing) subunit A [Simkaniaceae bacterium]
MSYTEGETVVPRPVDEEMKESYLRYSMSVIISRALPDVRDGLKPSQRRVLFAMRQLNLSPGAKHRKCAKICGDTSGDYHPHGETVIYPTLVRMAQDWVMGYCLVQGQGNFGSIDGDLPAAMRYTEARLTRPAVSLMEDLDKETVEFIPNYDETKREPTVFPAKFPNLLCNGSSGIAVGMATNIPPHNLKELSSATALLLKNSDTTIEEILKVLPGPDFPTGGMICGYKGIRDAYHTGRGKLMVRGLLRVEEMKKDQGRERIVIDEVPYNVNKSRLIERLAELVNEKTITAISDIRDESDKNGMRIAIDLKRGEIADIVINQIYKFTDMQVTFGCNMLALDKGLPRLMNIKQMIGAWITHRIEVIRARTRFELDKAEKRFHILEGYLKALDKSDEIVRLIRASSDREVAKRALIDSYAFSERQANAILDLRLYRLTGLERDKIEKERRELVEKIAAFKAILASEALVRDIIGQELAEVRDQDKMERRTRIVPAEEELRMEDVIPDESVIITISNDDYVKRMPLGVFREQRRGGQGVIGFDAKKDRDEIKALYIASTHDYLITFTNFGRCYRVKVWQIPESGRRAKGKALVNLLEGLREGEKIAVVLRVREFDRSDAHILLATKQGVVKKSALNLFGTINRKGVYAIRIDENDEVIAAHVVTPGKQVMLFTREGMAVRFDQDEIRSMGRVTRGVKGVTLKNVSDRVVSCEIVDEKDTVLVLCENGYGKRSGAHTFRQTHRGGVGVRSIITSTRNGCVVGGLAVTDSDSVVLMSTSGQTIRLGMQEIRVMGRSTQGVKVVNLKEGDLLVVMQKIKHVREIESKEIDE